MKMEVLSAGAFSLGQALCVLDGWGERKLLYKKVDNSELNWSCVLFSYITNYNVADSLPPTQNTERACPRLTSVTKNHCV